MYFGTIVEFVTNHNVINCGSFPKVGWEANKKPQVRYSGITTKDFHTFH